MSGRGMVKVSMELMVQALGFPDGTVCLSVYQVAPDSFEMVVEHEDLPESPEGGFTKLLPVFTVDHENRPATWGWITFDWGLDEQKTS
mgnify:FL=1